MPSVSPVAGAADKPVGIAASPTNAYVAGDVMTTYGRVLAVAQYDIPAQSGAQARLRSSLYYTNSAASRTDPIIADAMVISSFDNPSAALPGEVKDTRVYVASHSPNSQGKMRTMVTCFVTSQDPSPDHLNYGKLALSWTVYLDDLDADQGDEVPVAIAASEVFAADTRYIGIAIKSHRTSSGDDMRLVVLRGEDGKQKLNQRWKTNGTAADVPVGVVLNGAYAFIGGTTTPPTGTIGPRMVAVAYDIAAGSMSGVPLLIDGGTCCDATAVAMSGSLNSTDTQGTPGNYFAMAGYTTPINNVNGGRDVVTTAINLDEFGQLQAAMFAKWNRINAENVAADDVPTAVAINLIEGQEQVPGPNKVVVTGVTKADGEAGTQIFTLQYKIEGAVLQWYGLDGSPFGLNAYPTSIMYDNVDEGAGANVYVPGAVEAAAQRSCFANLKYDARCGADPDPQCDGTQRGIAFSSGQMQVWPSPSVVLGNDVAVSTFARNVNYAGPPSASGRWFFSAGKSERGATGQDWVVLGYKE